VTLTFIPRRAGVISRAHTKNQVQKSVGSKDRMETNKQTEGWTESLPIALPFRSENIGVARIFVPLCHVSSQRFDSTVCFLLSTAEPSFYIYNKKHLKNVGPIRHCEPPHALILHCHSLGVTTVARRLRIDVHDNNDNAWQRGPLWPHRMGPTSRCHWLV